MNSSLQNCCCCISVAMGTYVIGWLAVLGNFAEIWDFRSYRLITNLILTPFFLFMFFRDRKFTRRLWHYAYTLYTVLNLVYMFFIAYDEIMKEDGGLD